MYASNPGKCSIYDMIPQHIVLTFCTNKCQDIYNGRLYFAGELLSDTRHILDQKVKSWKYFGFLVDDIGSKKETPDDAICVLCDK